MKRIILSLTILLGAAALVAGLSSPVTAAVSGQCDNCHTMHYSQGGVPLGTWGDDGPYATLLINDCIGCHTGSDPFPDATPYVQTTGTAFSDDRCLAGGFFTDPWDINDNNSSSQHDIGSKSDPAGFDTAETTWYTGSDDGLGCGGTNGCHGNETDLDDMDAIAGGHHDTLATYRMLYVGGNAVAGLGAADYEEDLILNGTTVEVNTYSAGADDYSISQLCGKCHGDFHGNDDTEGPNQGEGPWERHPTDFDIPGAWVIGDESYTLDADDYKDNPVGYDFAAGAPGTERRVTCLSCHRAHGTGNADLLRWPYGEMLAGQTTEVTHGCLGCHDLQR